MPKQDKEFFSNVANCYAFAAKCATPTNGSAGKQARPGGHSSTGNAGTDAVAFAAGVVTDGGARVNQLGSFSVNAFVVGNIPQARADWYLIAMLVKSDGFHFVRRQRKSACGTPFWKWKQGNPGLVERNAFDPNTNDWIRVTDAQFARLVKNQLGTDGPGYGGWELIYFFEVQKAGFTVTAS